MEITRILKNLGGGGVFDSIVMTQSLHHMVDGFIASVAEVPHHRNSSAVYGFLCTETFETHDGTPLNFKMFGTRLDPRLEEVNKIMSCDTPYTETYKERCPYIIQFQGTAEAAVFVLERTAPYISGRKISSYLSGKMRTELEPGRWKDITDPETLQRMSVIKPPQISIFSQEHLTL